MLLLRPRTGRTLRRSPRRRRLLFSLRRRQGDRFRRPPRRLRAGGRTIVVQGCGAANVYPPENKDLYDRIVNEDRGAILSELPLRDPPLKENFLPRNRIIAGMSLGVLVVEANLKSGSLTTARLAGSDYGREVFALPGRVDSVTSAGTHHLIKTGSASLVDSIDDILDALGDVGEALRKHTTPPEKSAAAQDAPAANLFDPAPAPPPAAGPAPVLVTPTQQKILTAIEGDLSVDDLCTRTGLPAHAIMAELTLLQIRGHIKRAAGNRFTRQRR
jgi:DNA processing protein